MWEKQFERLWVEVILVIMMHITITHGFVYDKLTQVLNGITKNV